VTINGEHRQMEQRDKNSKTVSLETKAQKSKTEIIQNMRTILQEKTKGREKKEK